MRTDDIRETPNSTVSPGRNSVVATVLEVSSDDASVVSVVTADKEEDDMATYHRRRRAVCFTRARSPTNRSKESRRASEQFEKEVRVFAARGKVNFNPRRPPPPFIHRTQRFRKPAIQQCGVNQRSYQKPSRNHFERGQRLPHLATPSAPDDLVELVPRRANVGAKAKTLPFARCLLQSRCTNGDKTTGSLHPSSNTPQDEGLRRGRPIPRPCPTRRPTCDSVHCNRPRVAAVHYGPNL
jgi:Ni/Co efflux regulator RcnB